MMPSRDQSAWRTARQKLWYILSATSDAKVAVGLKWRPTTQRLRTLIEDGSIADMVCWHHVRSGDIVFVPAGTIHAIGPGPVIAEVQQRSDATFRLFDFGRQRELHVDSAVTVAHAGSAGGQTASRRLTDARTLLIACPYFVLERIDLVPNSIWQLDAASETWLLVLHGHARVNPMSLSAGEAAFLDADRATIQVGTDSFSGLVAYQGTEPRQGLLNALTEQTADSSIHAAEALS
jgi:mannose-6-phosphate isomerase